MRSAIEMSGSVSITTGMGARAVRMRSICSAYTLRATRGRDVVGADAHHHEVRVGVHVVELVLDHVGGLRTGDREHGDVDGALEQPGGQMGGRVGHVVAAEAGGQAVADPGDPHGSAREAGADAGSAVEGLGVGALAVAGPPGLPCTERPQPGDRRCRGRHHSYRCQCSCPHARPS